jgi:hypothetical protein
MRMRTVTVFCFLWVSDLQSTCYFIVYLAHRWHQDELEHQINVCSGQNHALAWMQWGPFVWMNHGQLFLHELFIILDWIWIVSWRWVTEQRYSQLRLGSSQFPCVWDFFGMMHWWVLGHMNPKFLCASSTWNRVHRLLGKM